MAIEIGGTRYLTAADVARSAGVSRQTLWRWRTEGKVPPGLRFRDGQILYTELEASTVLAFAQHLEPAFARSPAITTHEPPRKVKGATP